MTTTGPFRTEEEAQAASLYVRTLTGWGPQGVGSITELNLADLDSACKLAGVELGAYDSRIIEWLAQYEPATVAVIAGLISRAHEAGSHLTGKDGSEEAAP